MEQGPFGCFEYSKKGPELLPIMNTSFNNSSAPQNFDDLLEGRPEWQVGQFIRSVLSVFVCSLGIMGNAIAFCVTCRKSMRSTSSFLFLSILSVVDLLTLAFYLLHTLNRYYMNNILDSSVYCKTADYFYFTAKYTSVWTVVAITTERFLVIRYPLQSATMRRRRLHIMAAVSLIFLMSIFNLPILWYFELKQDRKVCGYNYDDYREFLQVWSWVSEGCIYAYVPIIILVTLNSLIIHFVSKSLSSRKESARNRNDSIISGKCAHAHEKQVTRMVMAVSFTFILTTLPIAILQPVEHVYLDKNDVVNYATFAMVGYLTQFLGLLNHAVNFLLYLVAGERFRKEFRDMVFCKKSSRRLGSNQSVLSRRSSSLNSRRSVTSSCSAMHKSTSTTLTVL